MNFYELKINDILVCKKQPHNIIKNVVGYAAQIIEFRGHYVFIKFPTSSISVVYLRDDLNNYFELSSLNLSYHKNNLKYILL